MIKVKANLRTKTSEKEVSDWHTDNHAVGGYTAIFYLNTNDLTSVFHDGDQIESKKGVEKLDEILDRQNRKQLVQACIEFLPTRVELDLRGWDNDIFSHSS